MERTGSRLAGKVAIITGAARGLGEGIATRFAEEGASVIVSDVLEEDAQNVAEKIGGSAIAADVTSFEDMESCVKHAVDAYGRLDIFVQNAGIYPWTLIEDTPTDEWDSVLAVNLKSAFLAAKASFPVMKSQNSGRLIFTSSITGPRVTSPGHGHYGAAKAGILGFVRSAALEFAPHGITVNAVEPGNIISEAVTQSRSSEFLESMAEMIPLGRLGSAEDVANAALYLASDEASYVTGTSIVVDGGQILPEGSDFRITPKTGIVE